jgi:putative MATE family efflux protein
MSAVAIVNQLLFVFYLCLWGAIAGAGIYSTQFFGKGDYEGVRYSMRFKIIMAFILCAGAILILYFAGPELISLYIAPGTPSADRAATMKYALQFLHIMLIGLVPFGITQCYAGVLRESGQTTLPMIASIAAMVLNFLLNLLLIFGYLGFPKLGVAGAGVATVIARMVEMLIVVWGAHRNKERYAFLIGVYDHFNIPKNMIKPILMKSLPLLCNEFLWSLGQAALLMCYSDRGIKVVAALNISNTISQIFNEVFLSLGNATSIVVGQELGAEHFANARRTAWRMAFLSLSSCLTMGFLLFLCAPMIPHIYNTEDAIILLATHFIIVVSICMPINGFTNVAYFTLRSGGKTFVTFLFDSCFSWTVSVPAAFVLTHFTAIPIIQVYLFICLLELIKCGIGFGLVRKGGWVRNIVSSVA